MRVVLGMLLVMGLAQTALAQQLQVKTPEGNVEINVNEMGFGPLPCQRYPTCGNCVMSVTNACGWCVQSGQCVPRQDGACGDDQMAMATAIDPDFPPLSIFGDEQMGDPVPALRAEAAKTPWQPVRPGLEYRRIETVDYEVSVLAWRYQESELDVKLAKSTTMLGETVEEFRKRTDAVLAINAGFFDLDFQSRLSPVGLLVVDGREIQSFDQDKAANPLTGILFVKDGRLGVIRAKDFSTGDRFESALQTGPLVVDPGGTNGIYRNSYDRQNRSAVCLGFDGTPIVVQVSGGLSLYELGELLSTGEGDGGFGCERAINLDGGPSSQISFLTDGLGVEVPGLWKVGSSLILTVR